MEIPIGATATLHLPTHRIGAGFTVREGSNTVFASGLSESLLPPGVAEARAVPDHAGRPSLQVALGSGKFSFSLTSAVA